MADSWDLVEQVFILCFRVTYIYIYIYIYIYMGFSGGSVVESACQRRRHRRWGVQSLGWEDPLQAEMATHSSILAWKIPWTEEPSGLQSMGSQRVDMTD